MRTSEDKEPEEKGKEGSQTPQENSPDDVSPTPKADPSPPALCTSTPPTLTPANTTFTFPFIAPSTSLTPPPQPANADEPAPVLSAQYEAVSDED